MSKVDEIAVQLMPVVATYGLELDELKILGSGKHRVLEVLVDADQRIDLDVIADVSRAISEYLDDSNVMGDTPYTLEVSTRGVGTPLTKPTHWQRNIGRLVTINGSGSNTMGRIIEFDDPIVTINAKGQLRKFDTATIERAVIEVEFNRKDEA